MKAKGNIKKTAPAAWLRWTAFLFASYMIIAALHGMAPGLWAKSYDGAEKHGPFRLLIFSPLLVLFFVLAVLVLLLLRAPYPCPFRPYSLRTVRPAWTLRGPPRLS